MEAAGRARTQAGQPGLEDQPREDHERLPRGLRQERERRQRRGVLPPEDLRARDRAEVTRLRTARVLHWALVASTALAALSLVEALGLSALHRPAGYVAVAVLLLRVVWGVARRRAVTLSGVVRMLCIAALALSGWLYTTDAYWGSEAV